MTYNDQLCIGCQDDKPLSKRHKLCSKCFNNLTVGKVKKDKFRGHEIEHNGTEWIYSDNKQSTVDTWESRPCGHCGQHNTVEGHDACLGTLPGVINACCGHGNDNESYVQYKCGKVVSKINA